MAFLNIVCAATEIAVPEGLWEWLLLDVFTFIANYGWRVVLFTLCLKLLLSPLDIFQRYKARKNQKITQRIAPQIEKLRQQYPDPQDFQQKQMALNKKEGISYFSSCLPSIATLVVFITLCMSLTGVSQYMNFKEYVSLNSAYHTAYEEVIDSAYASSKDTYDAIYSEAYDAAVAGGAEEADATIAAENAKRAALETAVGTSAKETAQAAVVAEYEEISVSFLWIKNIWAPDVPWSNAVNDKSSFEANIGDYGKSAAKSGYSEAQLTELIGEYETVMAGLLSEEYNSSNGFLILPILSMAMSIVMQVLSQRQQKQSGQLDPNSQTAGTMKFMMFLMPIMIGYFSLSYTAAFSLYMVASYSFSLVLTLGSNLLFMLIDKRQEKKKLTTVVKYGRPDPNDKKD